jgi:hypothetical protein
MPNDPVEARQDPAAQAVQRHTAQDQRTRIGRRVRAIERDLRAQLRRRGRTISIDADITIGRVAQAGPGADRGVALANVARARG